MLSQRLISSIGGLVIPITAKFAAHSRVLCAFVLLCRASCNFRLLWVKRTPNANSSRRKPLSASAFYLPSSLVNLLGSSSFTLLGAHPLLMIAQ
jgi:hypothetical protein